jgi:predicted dehydrogenase
MDATTPPPIKVAVLGVGRMGKHHARTLNGLPEANLLAVVDPDEERAETVADSYGVAACGSVKELIERFPAVQAVSVAVPTAHHVCVAEPLIRHGVACLVEKPLAATPELAERLVELAEQHGTLLQTGHTERFNPAVRALMDQALRPRFLEVHRISPMTFRSLDVGVVMDMMIHDLDIVLSLMGAEPERVDASGLAVLGHHEDIASVRMTFPDGSVANLTASRLAFKTERKLRLFGEDAYVSLDYQTRRGLVIRKTDNEAALLHVRQQLAQGKDLSDLDYSELVSVQELANANGDDESDPLTAELRSFLAAVRQGHRPVVDGRDGHLAVKLAYRIGLAIREQAHRWEHAEPPLT